ncbi:MAG: periplasmic heavy metal sensor [Acidobacteriia bacterium]|nr:periplasmic heavy metal sensor [Terriglobia bacterium]
MKKPLLKVLAAVAVGVLGLVAFAQMPKHHDPAARIQHHVDFLTKKLALTPAQQQQATTIFTNQANAGKAMREQMKTAHESLKAAVQKNDSAAIDQASNTIGNTTAQMISSRAKARAAFFATLTPDQQSKLTEMESHGRGKGWGHGRGRGGHGGPGGPGGPPPDGQF